jgi:hypothetical protein
MSYNISKGNSIQFEIDGEKLAFGTPNDDFGWYFGLFKFSEATGWNCPVWGATNGLIDSNLTNDKIMSYGSVSNYILARFPLMQEKLQSYLGAVIPCPDDNNKPECVGYDMHYDVNFNPADLSFALNKPTPLSHALPPCA